MIKKFSLFIFGLVIFGFINFSKSENLNINLQQVGGSSGSGSLTLDNNSVYCFYSSFNNSSRSVLINFQGFNDKLPISSVDVLCFSIGDSDNILNYEFLGGSYVTMYYYKVFSLGGSCDYSEYESQIESLSGSLNICQGMYERLDTDYQLLESNYNSCNSSLESCLNNGGSSGTGEIQRSSIFINNIQYLGGSVIRISIPEEISWNYTSENDQFDLDVEGYNVDTEYISGIIDTQSTLPNQVDLNNLVKFILPLFVPGLVIILFIYFIFRFIKKIF